jgi:tRNA G10  N-methylase Trm11
MLNNFYNKELAYKFPNSFVFVLGRETELCYAELLSVLKSFCFEFAVYSVADNLVFINSECEMLPCLTDILGGVVKIYKLVDYSSSDIVFEMSSHVEQSFNKDGRVTFGISSFSNKYDTSRLNRVGLSLKSKLKSKGYSARFIANTDSSKVSSIISATQLSKDRAVELAIFSAGLKESMGVMVGCSDPRVWSEVDYGKPAGDKYSGMLPPKLARIMINMATSHVEESRASRIPNNKEQITTEFQSSINDQMTNDKLMSNGKCQMINNEHVLVVDPFCGSGNLAIEAIRLGHDVIASDVSEKAVTDTKANIEWLKQGTELRVMDYELRENQAKILNLDATTDQFIKELAAYCLLLTAGNNIAVVAEPYLGEPKKHKSTMSAVAGEYSKVKDLYLGFLGNLRRLRGFGCLTVCMVFPLVETYEGKMYSLYQNSVDEIKKIGYTETQSPIVYGRDYQIVKREIVLLKISN